MPNSLNALWKLLLMASLALALPALPAASADETAPADDDAQRILGSWRSTRYEHDGKNDPTGKGGKIVFTPGHCEMYGLPPDQLELDATQNPRHFNWGPLKGIYELQGEWLRICMPSSDRDPRPTDFRTAEGDGRQMIVYKRLAALDPNAPDADFDAGLKKTIVDAVAALEKDDVETLMKMLVPPQFFDEMPAAERENMEKHLSSQKEPYLNLFRALVKIKPQMNAAGNEATFDLTRCHIEGGLPFPQIKFVKTTGGWHMPPQ